MEVCLIPGASALPAVVREPLSGADVFCTDVEGEAGFDLHGKSLVCALLWQGDYATRRTSQLSSHLFLYVLYRDLVLLSSRRPVTQLCPALVRPDGEWWKQVLPSGISNLHRPR